MYFSVLNRCRTKINMNLGKFLKNIKCTGQDRRAGGINFLKNIKCTGWNRHAGGKFSRKSINVQG